jgi:hypothetical protein
MQRPACPPCAGMASRPKRVCTERTRERIARILEWENCTENSSMFRAAAAQMDREFAANAADADYASDAMEASDDDDDEMDIESSEHSPPSSAGDVDLDDVVLLPSAADEEKNETQPTQELDSAMHAAIP